MFPNNTCGRCKNPIVMEGARFCTKCGYNIAPASPPGKSGASSYEKRSKEATG